MVADDITLLITAESQHELQIAAVANVEHVKVILKDMLLRQAIRKCQNIAFNPMQFPEAIFRRSGKTRYLTTAKRLRRQHSEVAHFLTQPVDFDPFEDKQRGTQVDADGYPFPVAETVEILGVTIGSQFALDEHFKNVIAKAAARQCLLTRVTSCHWGLEVGTLHITYNAAINSLLRYALAITGSVFPLDLVRRINTKVVKIAYRKIGRVGRTARIESPHFVMNAATVMNLYVPHCAAFLDGCARAQSNAI